MLRVILALAWASLTVVSLWTPSARADHILLAPPDPLDAVSRRPHIIRVQVQLGLAYEQQALEALQAAPAPEALADIAKTIQAGYIKFRFAVNGIRLKLSLSKIYQDPLLQLTAERIDEAMHRIRVADRAAQSAAAGSLDQVSAAIENLQAAIAIVELVAELI